MGYRISSLIGVQLFLLARLAISETVDPVRQIYQSHRDSFEITCWMGQSPALVEKAVLSPMHSTMPLKLMGKQLELRMLFPQNHSDAEMWTHPYPHHKFLLISRDAEGDAAIESALITNETGLLEFSFENIKSVCFSMGVQSAKRPFRTDLNTGIAHINVHPHFHYDPAGLLAGKVDPLLKMEGIAHYVFLEAQFFPYEVSQYLPGWTSFGTSFWNPEAGVNLKEIGNVPLLIAPSGRFLFSSLENTEKTPTVLITGGYLNACIGQAIPFLSKVIFDSGANLVRIVLVQSLLLSGPNSLMEYDRAGLESQIRDSFDITCRREGWDCTRLNLGFRHYEAETAPKDLQEFLAGISKSVKQNNPSATVEFHVWWDLSGH